MKKRMNGFMMMIPGCVDALKVVAAKLPAAPFYSTLHGVSIPDCASAGTPPSQPVVFCRRPSIGPPDLAPNTRFYFF
jgi:hypothetical protein